MYFWILFIGQGAMQEVLQEKESRVLPRILACPVTPGQYVLSKMLRCFVLCSLAAILLLVSSALLFGLKWGNPLKLAVAMAAWGVSMTGLLALIFALAHTKEQANVLSPLVLLVCAMLGGSMFPYENLPAFLQKLGQYIPNRWAVLALQGVARSKPLAELVGPLAGLVALGAGGSLLAFFLFKRRLADGGRK
jgi:ABC-2 type transport system permease protein